MLARQGKFRAGDWVIYRKSKFGVCPGEHAVNVRPSSAGESYVYDVDKFWLVQQLRDDGMLLLETRRGKQNIVDVADPRLRMAHWWEKIVFRQRFPKLSPKKIDP